MARMHSLVIQLGTGFNNIQETTKYLHKYSCSHPEGLRVHK